MKLYDGIGPNPKAVRMYIAEKSIKDIELVTVDMRGGENRQPEYLTRNPSGQVPVLETNSGQFVSEVPAICEYLEELYPENSLLGETPEERAETRSWLRKLDLAICEPMGNGFRFGEGLEFFKDRLPCFPGASSDLKTMAANGLAFFDKQLEGKTFICGERFSLADIFIYCLVSFFSKTGQPVAEELGNVHRWLTEVGQRPSSKA